MQRLYLGGVGILLFRFGRYISPLTSAVVDFQAIRGRFEFFLFSFPLSYIADFADGSV